VLKALGLGRLKNMQPYKPVRRYHWVRPGDMIHVDTRQLARFERVGHRITGDRRIGCSRGAEYKKAHVAIDYATQLTYVDVLPDEKQPTTVGFLLRAVAWFDDQGIRCMRVLSDKGSGYRSKPWREVCSALVLTQNTGGRTHHEPTAMPSISSKPRWRSAHTTWPFRPKLNKSAGCSATWRSITAVGDIWPWPTAPRLSSADC